MSSSNRRPCSSASSGTDVEGEGLVGPATVVRHRRRRVDREPTRGVEFEPACDVVLSNGRLAGQPGEVAGDTVGLRGEGRVVGPWDRQGVERPVEQLVALAVVGNQNRSTTPSATSICSFSTAHSCTARTLANSDRSWRTCDRSSGVIGPLATHAIRPGTADPASRTAVAASVSCRRSRPKAGVTRASDSGVHRRRRPSSAGTDRPSRRARRWCRARHDQRRTEVRGLHRERVGEDGQGLEHLALHATRAVRSSTSPRWPGCDDGHR